MLKVLAAVIAIIVIALAVVLILASTKPDTFRVERSAVIKASRARGPVSPIALPIASSSSSPKFAFLR